MRSLVLAVALVAAACSSSSSQPSGPCALRVGTYRLTWTQRDGDCGTIAEQIVTVNETQVSIGATSSPPAPCTGTIVFSSDNCTTTLEAQKCPEPATGGYSKADGKVFWAHDGSGGSGEIAFTGYAANGAVGCAGSYDLEYTRM